MILCDLELGAGLNTPAGNVGITARGRGRAWTRFILPATLKIHLKDVARAVGGPQ